MSIATILLAILVFGVLIFVHELGHFLTAKWSGIRVLEFAMGMGPKIFSRTRGETTYSLRAFPIGGYCAMEGEDEQSDDSRAFGNAPLGKRFLVMVAGSAMNLLLGLVLLGFLSSQMSMFGSTIVADFKEGSTSSAQLQVGDEITHMNGHRVRTLNDINYELSRSRNGAMEMRVLRDNQALTLPAVEFVMQEVDGVRFITMDFYVLGVEKTVGGVITNTFNWTLSLIKQVWGSLIDLVTGRYTVNQLSGPVGVTTAISEASTMGWQSVVLLVSLITINLGVFNLLPLPALDGGRLVFLLIELVRRRPLDPRYEGVVHMVGFMLLVGLMLIVTLNDVRRLL